MSDLIENTAIELTKKGQPRKRKPKQKNVYFTDETEEAILKYRLAKTYDEKNKLYNDKIHSAFYKLAENIIHTFKFYYTDVENIEDLKYEVISFLLQKIDLYDQSKGKAYSYFGTIVKRYLILYNQKNYKKTVSKIDFQDIHNEENTIAKLIEDPNKNEVDRLDVIDLFIKNIDDNLLDLFEKPEELKTADAILEILKKRENIDIINKKAVFIYVKEMADVQSSTITKVIKKLKSIYKDILFNHIENMDY
jgi:hemerythrin